MALNCSMLSPNNDPIPLPDEKIFVTIHAVTVSLTPTAPGSGTTNETPMSPTSAFNETSKKGKLSIGSMFSALSPGAPDGTATGTIYVTNQRICFVANNASSLPDPTPNPSAASASLPVIRTLTVPLSNSFDGRFVQPWLSANYHLSTVVPVPGGNLDQLIPSGGSSMDPARDSFTLKVVFNEGHGFEFHEALEEVKNIMFESESRRPAELEELPTYSPPMNNATLPSLDSVALDLASAANEAILPSTYNVDDRLVAAGDANIRRRDTMPDSDLLLAAQIATEEEFQERDIITQEPPPPSSRGSQTPDHQDFPPTYEP